MMLWSPPRRRARVTGPASLEPHRRHTCRPAPAGPAPCSDVPPPSVPRTRTSPHTSRPEAAPTPPTHLDEIVTVVAAPGLWAAAVAMAPAAPARGLALVVGWVGIASVLGRRRRRT